MSDVEREVRDVVDELVSAGAERGVQVAVYLRGEPVLDIAAGVADPRTGRPVTVDTPLHSFSIGKGVTATIVNMLVERGLFGYDTPVAELWPEFAAHGKHTVTVRHVLTHSAGVPGLPPEVTVERLCDWDAVCAAVADAEPWWEPGTRTGYHAYTFGFILGELVRRATGRRISEVLRDTVAGPLGVADELYFGMPVAEHHRLARLEDAEPPEPPPPGSPVLRVGSPSTFPTAGLGNRTDLLAADIPAVCTTSARAIVRMYAALLGEVDGVRLIPAERLREVTAVAVSGVDELFGNPAQWGLGYSIGLPGSTPPDGLTAFGMGGAGGSFAFADTATGLAVGVTKNRLGDFTTATRICRLVVAAVS